MPRTAPLVLATLLLAGSTHAGFVDLSLNGDTVDLWGGAHVGRDEEARFLIGGRFLYSDDDETDASVPAVLAAFSGRPSANPAIEFHLGLQGLFGEALDQDVSGIAVGGAGTWTPPSWKGAFVGARAFFAPSVMSFGDTDRILEWAIIGGYAITTKIRVFVEYTELTVDLEDGGDVDVRDDDVTGGIGVRF
jgi:hypothetical protein